MARSALLPAALLVLLLFSCNVPHAVSRSGLLLRELESYLENLEDDDNLGSRVETASNYYADHIEEYDVMMREKDKSEKRDCNGDGKQNRTCRRRSKRNKSFSMFSNSGLQGKCSSLRPVSPTSAKLMSSTLRFCPYQDVLLTTGEKLKFDAHAVIRFVDFNNDGLLDLLAASGGGIYYLQNSGDGRFINEGLLKDSAGTYMLTECSWCDVFAYIDINGDGIKDIISNEEFTLIYYPGVESNGVPQFLPKVSVANFVIPYKRLDVGDYDNDGLVDIITGSFEGDYYYNRNIGTPSHPRFSDTKEKIVNPGVLVQPYNTHPRLVDFNQDGQSDIIYGINWATMQVYVKQEDGGFHHEYFKNIEGDKISLRGTVGDNTAPDVGDVNNDGVVDLVTSGDKGNVLILLGALLFHHAMKELDHIMTLYPTDLGNAMDADKNLWNKIYDLHHIIQSAVVKEIVNKAERYAVYLWYRDLVQRYPNYFHRQTFEQPHLDWLSAYVWVIMLEAGGDTRDVRTEIARLTRQTHSYGIMLINRGVILVNDNQGDPREIVLLQRYLDTLHPSYFSLQAITMRDITSKPQGKYLSMKKGVCNIFNGDFYGTNQFPENCRVCNEAGRKPKAMSFLVVAAHEVGHNSLDSNTAQAYSQRLKDRKYELIHRTAGPEIKWNTLYSYNSEQTKQNFLTKGWWDGQEDFKEAMKRFFLGPGFSYDMNHLRQNYDISFFVRSPQEAFATLTNQYFDDTKLMLDYAWEKAINGYLLNIDWFLLCAEYYSLGTNTVPFWSIDGEGNISTFEVNLGRTPTGYIYRIEIPESANQPGKHIYEVEVDTEDDGFVKFIK